MPLITFLPSQISVELPSGTRLSDAARSAGVAVGLPCGGKGVCGRCLVRIESGKVRPDAPEGTLAAACRTYMADTPVTINTGAGLESEIGHFNDELNAIDSALLPKLSPMVCRLTLTVPEAQQGDGLSDYDRFCRSVSAELSFAAIDMPPDILAQLPEVLRRKNGELTLWYRIHQNILHIVSTEPREMYGFAADIGTTTVAAQIVSLETGDILAAQTAYNAQIDCGLDVISRIHYARDSARLSELREKILTTLNRLIDSMSDSLGISPESIACAALAGNTTMTHLLLGIIPEYIRLHPYTPAVLSVPVYTGLGLNICQHAPVWIAPSVGSYVGGDILAGLLCTPLSLENTGRGPSLFIDIGTNGEIVLGNDDFLLGCACSAGPAFEGGGIRHGCRASDGAIERVTLDAQGNVTALSVIGNTTPSGICGSGVISLTSELFRNGIIDAAGHFTAKAKLVNDGGRDSFPVAPGEPPVTFCQSDIENLIRAKAAIFSAVRTLLNSVGLTFDDLEHVYVSGGFGRYLDLDCAALIGLLPRLDGRISFLGNTSLCGAYMALISDDCRKKAEKTASRVTYIDLSCEAGYMDEYTAALFLPHTTLEF